VVSLVEDSLPLSYLENRYDSRGGKDAGIKLVFNHSLKILFETFSSRQISPNYAGIGAEAQAGLKCRLHYSRPKFARIRQILVELATVKFNENPPSGSRVNACGQTDIMKLRAAPKQSRKYTNAVVIMHFRLFLFSKSGLLFFLRIVGGGVQTGSTWHVGHSLAYCTCPR
jgi:hypothetical protein